MDTKLASARGWFRSREMPLLFSGAVLAASGLFALLLAATGRFLPHDEHFLGMSAAELCSLHQCRIVHFMVHDRASFGGALLALGILYIWLASSPMARGKSWAWWLFLLTGSIGFASFLAYLGYGYLDTWHGIATMALLPCFTLGLVTTRAQMVEADGSGAILALPRMAWRTRVGFGRVCLLAASAGIAIGGLVVLLVGATCVFVPQDLEYMGLDVAELHAINARLVPLIAHDRAGFGGAVCCCGVAMFLCVWCAELSPALWRVLCAAGAIGFGTAIGVHPAVGYISMVHLAPAITGAAVYSLGLILTFGRDR